MRLKPMKKIRTLKLGKMLLVLIKKECINEESDYSVENTSNNEDFRSTIFQPFQFEHEQKTAGESQEKEKKTYLRFSCQFIIY